MAAAVAVVVEHVPTNGVGNPNRYIWCKKASAGAATIILLMQCARNERNSSEIGINQNSYYNGWMDGKVVHFKLHRVLGIEIASR